jgi:hypothetical protein
MKNTFALPVFILLSFFSIFGQAQNPSIKSYDKVEIQTLYLNSKDSVVRFQVLTDSKKVKYVPALTYWWYKSNTILKTTGGADGKLLNGEYVSFYPDNNLKEKGKFLKGVKDELWITWFPNGKIQEQIIWKKGLMHGQRIVFDKDGNKISTENYKNGVLLNAKKKVTKKIKENKPKEKDTKQKETGKNKEVGTNKPKTESKTEKKPAASKKTGTEEAKPLQKKTGITKGKQNSSGK